MFISALFTIAKERKQPKYPSTDDKVKVLCVCVCVCVHIHTTEYYLVIKKNAVLPFVTTWMDLEGIMLVKKSQTEKTNAVFSLLYGI